MLIYKNKLEGSVEVELCNPLYRLYPNGSAARVYEWVKLSRDTIDLDEWAMTYTDDPRTHFSNIPLIVFFVLSIFHRTSVGFYEGYIENVSCRYSFGEYTFLMQIVKMIRIDFSLFVDLFVWFLRLLLVRGNGVCRNLL